MNQQSLCPFQKRMGVLFLEKVSHFLKVLRFWSLYESCALRVESIVNSQWYSGSASSFAKRAYDPGKPLWLLMATGRPPLRSSKMCCRCHVYEFHSFQSCSTYSGQRRKTLHSKLVQVMEPQAWGYYSSGGDDEITLRDNHMVSMAEEIQVSSHGWNSKSFVSETGPCFGDETGYSGILLDHLAPSAFRNHPIVADQMFHGVFLVADQAFQRITMRPRILVNVRDWLW